MAGGFEWVFGGRPVNTGKMAVTFSKLLDLVTKELFILVPYLDVKTTQYVLRRLEDRGTTLSQQISLRIAISPDPLPYVTRLADLKALQALLSSNRAVVKVETRVAHPLHAKVYLADSHLALVTSANLTGGGMESNAEAGFLVSEESTLSAMRQDCEDYVSVK